MSSIIKWLEESTSFEVGECSGLMVKHWDLIQEILDSNRTGAPPSSVFE